MDDKILQILFWHPIFDIAFSIKFFNFRQSTIRSNFSKLNPFYKTIRTTSTTSVVHFKARVIDFDFCSTTGKKEEEIIHGSED